jgi:hypothetical protein
MLADTLSKAERKEPGAVGRPEILATTPSFSEMGFRFSNFAEDLAGGCGRSRGTGFSVLLDR